MDNRGQVQITPCHLSCSPSCPKSLWTPSYQAPDNITSLLKHRTAPYGPPNTRHTNSERTLVGTRYRTRMVPSSLSMLTLEGSCYSLFLLLSPKLLKLHMWSHLHSQHHSLNTNQTELTISYSSLVILPLWFLLGLSLQEECSPTYHAPTF